MAQFKWSDACSVYVAEIDAEHRVLFRLAEDLRKTIKTGGPTAQVIEAIRSLLAHEEDHFAHEEYLMRAAAYPAYDWHKLQHDTARKKSRQLLRQFAKGDVEAATLLVDAIGSWLSDHVGVTDRMMGAYLRNHERLRTALAS